MPELNHDSCIACGCDDHEHLDRWKPDQAAKELVVDLFLPAYERLTAALIERNATLLDAVGHLELAREMMETLRDKTIDMMRKQGQDSRKQAKQ